MTVIHLTQLTQERTPAMQGGTSHKIQRSRELLFGLTVTALIIGGAALSAFNGGFSLQAGGVEMTLDASLTQGMRLSFVSA